MSNFTKFSQITPEIAEKNARLWAYCKDAAQAYTGDKSAFSKSIDGNANIVSEMVETVLCKGNDWKNEADDTLCVSSFVDGYLSTMLFYQEESYRVIASHAERAYLKDCAQAALINLYERKLEEQED